ncbi:type II toxin-antitoxin system RelE/ParE family toxin [Kitasatospora sp. SUK 42]|uniref:type II toxin-antitoxin system RelE/ParE family toxin n=1 Tax=Kitasatospora sp. SUK 42 TaxID=1588882 RepID=UPI0018CB66D9|nr:type II toxin-antitoxin system RelE/ParE family toxin [Kitasatospora sp. SUK 42]MBV2154329.1 type II toxin-antitoxin system RelE/ParE family toxin [Kitasatospora sp. SUK 42]
MGVDRFTVEIEPEVRDWLVELPARHYVLVEGHVDRLAEYPTTLDEPLSRHLDGPLRELRLRLDGAATRITYWLAPGRRIILLTVFTKRRMRETAEVTRALWAQKICESEHEPAHEEFSRIVPEGELR